MKKPIPVGDASSAPSPTDSEVRPVNEWPLRHQSLAFSQFRLLVLLLATTVGLSVFQTRQTLDTVRVMMLSSRVSADALSSTLSQGNLTAAQITTTSSNSTALRLTGSTVWQPELQMAPLPPLPFTMNRGGGVVFFLHIPKTGKYGAWSFASAALLHFL